jgi:hypothetical protein
MNALVAKSVIGQIEPSYGIINKILRYDFLFSLILACLRLLLGSHLYGFFMLRFLSVVENDRRDENSVNLSLFFVYVSRKEKLRS